MATLPGYKIWENAAILTTGGSPYVSNFFDTTGYTSLLVESVITTAGTVTFTVEGSFDGSTLDSTMTYADTGLPMTATVAPAGLVVVVKHTFVRFRVVVITSNPTVSTFYVQSRA